MIKNVKAKEISELIGGCLTRLCSPTGRICISMFKERRVITESGM